MTDELAEGLVALSEPWQHGVNERRETRGGRREEERARKERGRAARKGANRAGEELSRKG